jgi:hypothetical protein
VWYEFRGSRKKTWKEYSREQRKWWYRENEVRRILGKQQLVKP